MIPLLISPENLKVLVIGGGPVALRKCMHFIGAKITVISENTMPEIDEIAGNVIKKRTTSEEVSRMMEEFNIIIAATSDAALNREITDAALSRGLYVNSAHGGGNVVIPSVLKRDRYIVSVSTEGKIPAFPPFVVRELDAFLDKRFDIMFDVLAEARKMCAGRGTQPDRSEFLKRVTSDPEVDRFVKAGDISSALKRVKKLGVPI
jgi:siroheme synthase-like protein